VIVRVMSRHMDVTPAIKAFAEQKASKLTKHFDRISEIEVILDAGTEKTNRDHAKVEIIVHVEHTNTFIAHQDNGDAYAGIDACVEKLERQLTDHKERLRNRKHPEIDAKRGAQPTAE
jgi:putative sigma-54 modulation protein